MFPVDRLVSQFQNVCSGRVMQISQLTKNQPYPVVGARIVSGQYGLSVILSLHTAGDVLIRVYLPKRYSECFDEEDCYAINQGSKKYTLEYLGVAGQAYLLKLTL